MMTTEDGNTIALVPWESCGELGEAFSMPFFNQNVKPVPKRIVIREKNFVQAMRKEGTFTRFPQHNRIKHLAFFCDLDRLQ